MFFFCIFSQTIGNHEFDIGTDKLANFLQTLNFPAVSANVDVSNETVLDGTFTKTVVKEINGEQIGIVGYTYRGTSAYAHASVGKTI